MHKFQLTKSIQSIDALFFRAYFFIFDSALMRIYYLVQTMEIY